MFTRGLVLSGGRISVLILIALEAGCAGTSDSKSGAGGAGGAASNPAAAGSAGSDAGPPSQAAFSVRVAAASPAVNGMACPVAATTYAVGSPPPSAMDPGNSVVSAQDGAFISCSVRGAQPFTFSASIHATAGTGDPVTFVLSNGTVSADGKGTANVSFFAPELANQFTSTSTCQVSVVNGQAKPGSMWASFSCDALSSPPSGLCSASGVFVLENCDGS